MTDDNQLKPARLRPWLRIVFGVSVALNLAVAGLVAGAFLRPDKREAGHRPPPIGAVLYRELSKEDRRVLRKAATGSHEERAARRGEDADALADALRSVPFDAARVDALLDQHGEQIEDFQRSVGKLWLDRVVKMSDDERAEYADRLHRAMMAPPKGKPPKRPDRD